MFIIKKILKISTIVFGLLFFGFVGSNVSYASENTSSEEPKKDKVIISVTNNETKETTYVDYEVPKQETSLSRSMNLLNLNSTSQVETHEVFIPLETPETNDSGITPFSTEGKTKTDGGVKATLNVNYDINSTNEKVRVNKVYGSWKPTSGMYKLKNRVVEAHSGVGNGLKLKKTPTSNSFTYTTGWGYVHRVWDQASPRAWSSAVIYIEGMSATYTIKVEFAFS